jgi:hypothetical protein
MNNEHGDKSDCDKAFDCLVAYLSSITPREIVDASELEKLLSSCWDQFDGSDAEGMAGYKLHRRMEKVSLNPPLLTFTIERHGGIIMGSSRASLHDWRLDLSDKTAVVYGSGHRQLTPMQPRVNVEPLAQETAELILNRQNDERLKWHVDGSVTVHIGTIIADEAAKQTVGGRRKRFREALNRIVTTAGWDAVRAKVYRPPTS